jgi:hypothetical protein
VKRPRQHLSDRGDDAHQLRHFGRLVAAAQRPYADTVMPSRMLGPRSSCSRLVLAKEVHKVQAVVRVVVLVELLGEKRRELFCMAGVLVDSATLNCCYVRPRTAALAVPIFGVVVAAPKLPRPLERLLLANANLDVERRQGLFAGQVRECRPAEARPESSQPLLVVSPRETVAAAGGRNEPARIHRDLRHMRGDLRHVESTWSAFLARQCLEAGCRQQDRLPRRNVCAACMIRWQSHVEGWPVLTPIAPTSSRSIGAQVRPLG